MRHTVVLKQGSHTCACTHVHTHTQTHMTFESNPHQPYLESLCILRDAQRPENIKLEINWKQPLFSLFPRARCRLGAILEAYKALLNTEAPAATGLTGRGRQ